MKMTILHLEILMHHYTSPGPFPRTSHASRRFTRELCRRGLLNLFGEYSITPAGALHVQRLKMLPVLKARARR